MMGEVYYNEHDPKAAAWLRELIKAGLIATGVVDERSIVDVNPYELTQYTQHHFFAGIGGWSYALRLAGWPDDKPVVTGSCPCQPFSVAGKGLGITDPRHLWPFFRNIITFLGPTITLGEQVASKAGRDWLAAIRVDLEALGYEVGAADLCSASIGAPQIRQRLYWVANTDNSRWKRAKRIRESHPPRQEWQKTRSESLRPVRRPRPPGPREVAIIPSMADGLPGVMVRCRGYGNAIDPELAAEFIKAATEAIT